MRSWLQQVWYAKTATTQLLRPLSWLFCSIVFIRRWMYRLRLLSSTKLDVPVVIIGNLTVGGSGKTPLVIHVVQHLKKKGYRPGVVSRGYGGKAKTWPQQVRPDSDPVIVGDEPILIAKRTRCPMAVGPDRVSAAKALLQYADIDIIVSDDGLQHYAMQRDIEVIVIDAVRRFGNGYCLPAGPLREPVKRMLRANFLISNGSGLNNEYAMRYTGSTLVNLQDPGKTCELKSLQQQTVHAIAGIGNPDAFFTRLRKENIEITPHPFPDHHVFSVSDFDFGGDKTIIMTEKDAVKCQRFATEHMWYLPIEATVCKDFEMQLLNQIEKCYG